jgi:hypothetical protein
MSREDDTRDDWLEHVEAVIRSRHYTWLPEGLGGEAVDVAMTYLVADIMHVCRRAGISWEDVLLRARDQFQREEAELGTPPTHDRAT